MRWELRVDKKKCNSCGICERILPSFITKYEGVLPISDRQKESEIVNKSISCLKKNCSEDAIDIYKV